ncbi:MAG: hypothetical protein K2I40_02865 [Bifidobacterium castoris]|nr:hypothetical protein [Bifidobacterium castoris]
MRKQTQCHGLWQNSTTGEVMYADTRHGALWTRNITDTTETWTAKNVAASNVRGYLAALSESGWIMVSGNGDVAREEDAYTSWYRDMFPNGIPRRVTDFMAALDNNQVVACSEDAANGWTCATPSVISHPLSDAASLMIRMTMRGDCDDDAADVEDDFDVPDVSARVATSVPTLPAECAADTQEIPEVPPTPNAAAQVLATSEDVIPATVTLREFALTRDVPRKRIRQFRDARGRKCAYVVRADDGAFILWRDWYEHEDAALDAEVRAYYASVA